MLHDTHDQRNWEDFLNEHTMHMRHPVRFKVVSSCVVGNLWCHTRCTYSCVQLKKVSPDVLLPPQIGACLAE